MMLKAVSFFMLLVGGIAFPLNEEKDMSFFFDNTVDPFIVGGVVAAERVPHMVALVVGITTRGFFCGGSVINNRFILTAGHCIEEVLDGNTLLRSFRGNLGSNRLSSNSISYGFSRFVIHPGYSNVINKNDIGLLMTTSAIAFSDIVQPIVLNFDFIEGGAPAIVNGWGRYIFIVDGGPPSRVLRELRPSTVDGERCISEVARVAAELNKRVPPVDPELEICAFFENNTGTCHGDSGSALVLEENKQQIGIVSWGVQCSRGAPDMYVRVSAFKSWIEQQLHQLPQAI